MKVIYCGYRATYGAYLMAALHAGIYKGSQLPSKQFIEAHFDMCRLYGEQYGNLIYVGLDEGLNEIYAMGCNRFFSVIEKAQACVTKIFKIDEELYHIDVTPLEGFLPRFMGFLLARRVYTRLCQKLFFWWFKHKYGFFAKAVQRQKRELEKFRLP
nr:hypothetical protein [Clostridia bacterium]